ncbi:Dehydrogenase RED2 [Penicillium capsulatum]|uniref:Short-chain dehydrogenase/reductase 3 n=1 Tax=Penicillium capsulatum TaxID=69766 RepID=A0A9W9LMK8_9EURO|nr:Dehydrogenase RED2 [Penicillium capsulatum]KAJ6117747.1 Dehydrogenase RED2 [Penicillium capsulatum]
MGFPVRAFNSPIGAFKPRSLIETIQLQKRPDSRLEILDPRLSTMSAFDLVQQYAQSAVARLPDPAQDVLRNPLTQKALGVVLALGVLRSINKSLSQWSQNNWCRNERWNSARELILLTGGCSGIGKQVMEDLARTGVRVIILDINEPNFTLPANVFFYRTDITSSAKIAEVAKAIRSDHGDPTVLINNAGVGHDGTILEEPEAKIRQTFEVNTLSHWWMVREFLPAMVRANHGHVITVASMASFVALGEIADYCGSKASALAFHESLRQELKGWYHAPNVRTSIIHPFWVRTPMIKMLTDYESHFRQPIMTVQTVADAITKQVLTQNSGQIVVPGYQSNVGIVRALPTWIQEGVRTIASSSFQRLRQVQSQEQ